MDLLRPAGKIRYALKVVVDKDGPKVEGATQLRFLFGEVGTASKAENKKIAERVITEFKQGLDNRKMRSTEVNETSSRSHLLFSLFVGDIKKPKKAKITFADLAGSERVACIALSTHLYEEAIFINESLKYLGFIVRWLAAGRDYEQLDFKANLLTWLLSDCIGGGARTLMFVCISPSDYDREATMDTLRFAMQTGKIINKPGTFDITTRSPGTIEITGTLAINKSKLLKMEY